MQQNIARISALASKMSQIKNVKAYYYHLVNAFIILPNLEARAEILAIFRCFFEKF